jgi:hypothetical protein
VSDEDEVGEVGSLVPAAVPAAVGTWSAGWRGGRELLRREELHIAKNDAQYTL